MCPDGWEVFQGRCYYFVDEGMTWPQAQSNCAMLESMLASVDSVQEYGFLQQLTSNTGNQDAWLGGFYLQDQWLWLDGSWFYNNSLSMESPDSSNPCLMLNIYEGGFNSPCDAGGYVSICEKSSNVPLTMVCPEGWTGFQGRCYFYNGDSLTWSEAETNCVGLQASLVSVHSPQQYFFLYQQTAVNGFSNAWLGGFYLEDQWMWLDGSWFYQGFSDQMSQGSTSPCLSTYDTSSLRMKPRCLLSAVDRLPTISEMQESDTEDGDLDCSSHTMKEYVDSIKELSQPAPYPRHGPLRGHRRWMVRRCPGVTPVASTIFLNSSSTYAPWIPVDLSDVSFTLLDQSNSETSLRFNHNLLDRSASQSLFAGLV
eukprot:superscaffoldBa00001465_g10677